MPETDNERWISLKETCEYLGVKRHTIIRWIEQRQMPAAKVGKFWKFKISEIDAWIRDGGASE